MKLWLYALAGSCVACVPVTEGDPVGGIPTTVTIGDEGSTGGDDEGPDNPVTGPSSTAGVSASAEGSTGTGVPELGTTGTTIIDFGSEGTSDDPTSSDPATSTSTGGESSSSTGCPPVACDQPCGEMDPTTAADGQVDMDYELVFTGPDGVYEYDWFILPWAPPGLEFTVDGQPNAEAMLTGTPTEAGDFEFTVIANPTGLGCVNADALIVEFTLTVDP